MGFETAFAEFDRVVSRFNSDKAVEAEFVRDRLTRDVRLLIREYDLNAGYDGIRRIRYGP